MKELKKIKVFSELEDKTKVISPIDNVVTEFRRYKESGEAYLCSQRSAYPIFQFNPEDFVVYTGAKDIDEVDEEFFKNSWYCKLKKNKSEWGWFITLNKLVDTEVMLWEYLLVIEIMGA